MEGYPYPFRNPEEEKPKETELEIEVQQCYHMILNLKKPCWINLGTSDSNKTNITRMEIRSGKEITCFHTKKTCVLYSLNLNRWLHSSMERCPSFKDSVVKYKIRGVRRENMFHVSKIEKLD